MDLRFSEEELLWIRDMLDQHGEYLHDILEEAIESRNLILSGDLQQSLSYKVSIYGQNPALAMHGIGGTA